VDEYKSALARRSKLRKFLVNHLAFDGIRRMPSRRKIDIIPIEICYTTQTIRKVEKIKANSSLIIVLPNHAAQVAGFIVDRLHKLIKCKGVDISWVVINTVEDFEQLVKSSRCDRILVSPGARNTMPVGKHPISRILQLEMDFDPEGLETARIRAGVIA
jgi:hypothetical protein